MKSFLKIIFNKGTKKRFIYIYLPLVIGIYAILFFMGFISERTPDYLVDEKNTYSNSIPIVYSPKYNIKFFGLEEFHPFDSKKYGRAHDLLKADGFDDDKFIQAKRITEKQLSMHHDKDYLDSLKSSWTLAKITELRFLRFFPGRLSNNLVLEPMMYQTGGTLMAGMAALEHGWSVNLGGGFHHASSSNGEGFCAIADISLLVKFLRHNNLAQKFMIIDLDAHQGNGHGQDFINDDDVYIFDIYNSEIYPHAHELKAAIDLKVELRSFSGDKIYNNVLVPALIKAFEEFSPDMVIYIAGTDVLEGDPLGGLGLSKEAIINRDELVFQKSLDSEIPIVMLLGGGYQKSNASVIAESISNLNNKLRLLE